MSYGRGRFGLALALLLSGAYVAWPDPPMIGQPMLPQQMHELRKRAWKLLPLFGSQADGMPDPANWITAAATFGGPGGNATPSNLTPQNVTAGHPAPEWIFDVPREYLALSAGKGGGTAPPPDIPPPPLVYESTFYNRIESHSIRAQGLDNPQASYALLQNQRREISFPENSVAMKTFWYVVDDHTTVALWDWRRFGPTDDLVTPIAFRRPVCVRLNATAASGCLDAKKYFYTATKDDSMTFKKPDDSAPDVRNGQTLILVALHIVSKQLPDWLWATFWWRGEKLATHGDSWTCADAQREAIGPDLARMPGVWKYYSMDVDASFQRRKPPVNDMDVKPCGRPGKIGIAGEEDIAVYNPFVEALLLNGRKSSCIGCHALAYTGMTNLFPKVPPLGSGDPDLILPTFEMQIRTDYMWKVANSLSSPALLWPPEP